jgi:cell division protein FtsB
MRDESERRQSSIAGGVFAFAVLALMTYLAIAALQGRYGLFSLLRAEAQEAILTAELSDLRSARAYIARKARGLSTDTLEPDLLDEQARRVLGLGRGDEVIIRR